MKTKKYSEEQIIAALQEADGGAKVEDVCRRLGIVVDQALDLQALKAVVRRRW